MGVRGMAGLCDFCGIVTWLRWDVGAGWDSNKLDVV